MVVVWGTRMMGKVDAVPGVGHVATRFFYLQFIPLVPVETYLVFREVGEQVYGVKIPFSPKSIFVTWLRTGLILASLGLAFAGCVQFSERREVPGAICIVLSFLSVAAFIYSYYFGPIAKAGYNRAISLAQRAGLEAEKMLALEIAYGRMNADQAERELARLYAEAQRAHEQRLAEEPPSPEQFVFK